MINIMPKYFKLKAMDFRLLNIFFLKTLKLFSVFFVSQLERESRVKNQESR
jgi:hypothetical protein